MFAAPITGTSETVNVLDLIPEEHRPEAERFFASLTMEAQIRGITVAEALADALRPHLRVLRRAMGIEAFEERAITITDTRGNELSFALLEPGTRHLSAA